MLLFPYLSEAQGQYDIYAGFMFHFGKFVQWPSELQSGDFVIGLVGDCPIKNRLDNFAATKNINGRKIVIRTVASTTDLKGCNILFIPKNENAKLATYASGAKTYNILLVTESEGNITKGAVFNFIEKEGKVRFEFNQSEADSHVLKVSADLVKLAVAK
jgi:hypothetical protein